MPRKPIEYKQPSYVSGLSVDDIMNLPGEEFNKLNLSDMRKVVSRLVSAGNKRIRRLEKADLHPTVLDSLAKSGGKFSTKGKNLNQLRAEFVRAKQFLSKETSSVTGYKKVLKEISKKYAEKGIKISAKGIEKMWSIYARLKDLNPTIAGKNMKYSVLNEISNYITTKPGVTVDDAINALKNITQQTYEKMEDERNRGEGGISGFFELEDDI